MSPLQVLVGPLPTEHRLEWVLDTSDVDPEFKFRCRYCGQVQRTTSFAWLGGDGPRFGSVLAHLFAEAAKVPDEDCPELPF